MRIFILAAAVAVVCTSFATAAEVNKDTTKAPVVAGKTMTDADMDNVTAGGGRPDVIGGGLATAESAGANPHASYQGTVHGIGRCNNISC